MTVFQKQCLLAYLGYYEGSIDGQWGNLTQQATEAFQADYQLTVDGIFGNETRDKAIEVIASLEPSVIQQNAPGAPMDPGEAGFWKSSKYFAREEFRCKCGRCGGFPAEPAEKLVRLLNEAREDLGAPGIIISGVRCPAHNSSPQVGGVANSRHLRGWAVDILFRGKTPAQMEAYFKSKSDCAYCYQIKDKQGRLCGDVHVDVVV